MTAGRDFGLYRVECGINNYDTYYRWFDLITPPAGSLSEGEFLFLILSQLSAQERAVLHSFKAVATEGSFLPPFFMNDPCFYREIENAVFNPFAEDQDICPACMQYLISGSNPLCECPAGCGRFRQLPDVTPYEDPDHGN